MLNLTGAVASAFGNMVLTLFIFAFMLGGMWEMERRASKRARKCENLSGSKKIKTASGKLFLIANAPLTSGFMMRS